MDIEYSRKTLDKNANSIFGKSSVDARREKKIAPELFRPVGVRVFVDCLLP